VVARLSILSIRFVDVSRLYEVLKSFWETFNSID